ncbi:MAG: hypothetical protein ABI693_32175 [Bryobacteraceae bacterium]
MKLLPVLLPAAMLSAVCACAAAEPLAGRWEGAVHIPALEIPLVIDVAPDDSGQWRGSATVPGFGAKGVTVGKLKVTADTLACTIDGAMGGPELTAHLAGDGTLQGEYVQGGNKAALSLHRVGAAQVELPRVSTAVRKELEGAWEGEYELMGTKRKVFLDLTNESGKPAAVKLTIIGKRENKVPVSMIIDDVPYMTISSQEFQLSFELRHDAQANTLSGDFTQGPFEVPVSLHRPVKTGGTSK